MLAVLTFDVKVEDAMVILMASVITANSVAARVFN